MNRWGRLQKQLAKENSALPAIHFSCDSGYSDVSLSEECAKKENNLIYISIPIKSHIVYINNKKTKLNEYINTTFLAKEKQHQEGQRHLKEKEKTPFTLCLKAFYQCQKEKLFYYFLG